MLSPRGVPPNRCSVDLKKQQNPWKTSFNKLSFNKNTVLEHATLLSQEN